MKLSFVEENMEIELRLTSLAVEKIEDEFDTTIDEFFSALSKLKAKTVNFVLWVMANTQMDIAEFKILLAKYYTYEACIKMLTEALHDPNAPSSESPALIAIT